MQFDINLHLRPSASFIGILAELNEKYSDWTDGSYDWANQTTDFLSAPKSLPELDVSIFQTPLSQRALNDLLQIGIAMMAGNFVQIRDYLKDVRYSFVVGFPRSGGSYLTKEMIRSIGLDHTRVSEALAHDGFPGLRDTWYDLVDGRPYYHLQDAIFQVAEFLVISSLYYRRKTTQLRDGYWLVPKKMHKLVSWSGSMKMLLGGSGAEYLVTVRHPVPTAISIYEKSGGKPESGRFPGKKPRSAIEQWIVNDLVHLGYNLDDIDSMDYFEAVRLSWMQFHLKLATSGIFLAQRKDVTLISYGKDTLEQAVTDFGSRHGCKPREIEEVVLNDKAAGLDVSKGDVAVEQVRQAWAGLGLSMPELTLA